MSFQGFLAVLGTIFFLLGIVFFFIEGMLGWSILFVCLGIFLGLIMVTWGISGTAEKIVRNLSKNDD